MACLLCFQSRVQPKLVKDQIAHYTSTWTATIDAAASPKLRSGTRTLRHNCMHVEAQAGAYWSYVAGVAYYLVLEHEVHGIHIDNYKSSLPARKGLSSSAAVSVLVWPSLSPTIMCVTCLAAYRRVSPDSQSMNMQMVVSFAIWFCASQCLQMLLLLPADAAPADACSPAPLSCP
jgi:hypothetical protein